MFKILNESDNCILFHEDRSQIVNYANFNKLNFELCKKYDQLTFMVETGLRKLTDTIDKLISAQNTLTEVLKI